MSKRLLAVGRATANSMLIRTANPTAPTGYTINAVPDTTTINVDAYTLGNLDAHDGLPCQPQAYLLSGDTQAAYEKGYHSAKR